MHCPCREKGEYIETYIMLVSLFKKTKIENNNLSILKFF